MKRFEEQTYFEILDVPLDADQSQLDAAYSRAKKYLGPDSVALYSLADPGEAEAFIARVEAAYQVLSDPELREKYRSSLADPLQIPPPYRPKPAPRQQTLDSILADADSAPWSRRGLVEPDAPVAAAAPPDDTPKPDPKVETPVATPEVPEAPPPSPPQAAVRATEPAPPPEAPTPSAAPAPSEAPALASEMALDETQRRTPAPARPQESPRPLDLGPDAQFSGELLRRVRESKGLGLRDLADRTRITLAHLESVEADHYDALPVRVYLRGMLMSIARELRLDPVRVSRSYLDLFDRARGVVETKVDAPKRRP
jgi:curved DNA-binding protein CbpA